MVKDSIDFMLKPTLPLEQRSALEHLFFFNPNQHRVLSGIQRSIESYGVPEIVETPTGLRIRVGELDDVQNLFAVSKHGTPLGVAVFVQLPNHRFVVLHLVIDTRLRSSVDVNTPVLLELMREIRSTARCAPSIKRVDIAYDERNAGAARRSGAAAAQGARRR